MISWNDLCYDLAELSKLPNGDGSEIEFELRGKRYMIIHYRNEVTLTYYPTDFEINNNSVTKSYVSVEAMGNAKDFGFCLKDEWNNISNLACEPRFDEYALNEILEGYRSALDTKHKQ